MELSQFPTEYLCKTDANGRFHITSFNIRELLIIFNLDWNVDDFESLLSVLERYQLRVEF